MSFLLQGTQTGGVHPQSNSIHGEGPQTCHWKTPPEDLHPLLPHQLGSTIEEAGILWVAQAVRLHPALDHINGDVNEPGGDSSDPPSKEAAAEGRRQILLTHQFITIELVTRDVD